MLRSIGQNPTEDEILNLVVEFDVNGDGTIDFEEFLDMMGRQAAAVDQDAEDGEGWGRDRVLGGGESTGGELQRINQINPTNTFQQNP